MAAPDSTWAGAFFVKTAPGVASPATVVMGGADRDRWFSAAEFAGEMGGEFPLRPKSFTHIISTNMNGVGGLRTIDCRTVLARWSEQVPEGGEADREKAEEAARLRDEDYQLAYAIDILKGLSAIGTND